MKKLMVIVLAMTGMLSMTGCAATEKMAEKMYIEPAQLTEEETNIASRLGLNAEQRIYDFVLDQSVQSIQVNTYRLVDGEWKLEAGGGGQAFSDVEGRIAFSFERLDKGLRTAIQSEHTGGATEFKNESNGGLDEIGSFATSVLSEKAEFVYEEEIPLVVQIITSKNEIVSYQVDYFNSPEEYEKFGYEGVFAITIRFSQKTVAELEVQSDRTVNETETISFHDRTFNKADLSQETIEWLEWYNELSKEDQLAISYIPSEVYKLSGYPESETIDAETELILK